VTHAEPVGPEIRKASHSAEHLIALAVSMEREAAARYDDLANDMWRAGYHEMADLFTELSADERRHEAHILAWGISPATPGRRAGKNWCSPEAFTDEDRDEAGGDYLMTPHRALSLAVRNEERAFALFSTIAAMAKSAAVRTHAETLATEELGHLVRLRVERRRAWRAQAAGAARGAPGHGVLKVRTLAALITRALAIEREAVGRCAEFAAALDAAGDADGAALLRVEMDDIGRQIVDLEQHAADADISLPEHEQAPALGAGEDRLADPVSRRPILELVLRDADDALTFYLAAAEMGASEGMVQTAHGLAERTLHRLRRIKSQLDD